MTPLPRARGRALAILALATLAWFPQPAQAWELFRSENKDTQRGNALLTAGKSEEATAAYDAAQRKLPHDPGVQLNKGLGLLASGKLPEARDAFRSASQAQGSAELRGKANYNLGLTLMREADVLAKGDKFEDAQKLLTESVDAFKNSLRNVPHNRDAAWNLELAKRRLVEAEKKKQEQQDQQKQDQENQDQQKQDGQDPQKQDQQKQGQENQDQQKQDSKQPEGDKQEPNKPEPKADAPQEQPTPKQGEQDKPQDQQKQQAPEPSPTPSGQKPLPENMQRALDALSESDDNLQKQRAKTRARQRPQRIEKDW